MNERLNLLIVEDSENDAALVVRLLRRAGYDVRNQRVETAGQMQSALDQQTWDVVICDYHMPAFTAPAALALVQQTGVDIPFIVVSGAMGEDVAVAMMRAGAHDYLLKDKLERLAPAVARELRGAQTRRERQQTEEALRLRFAELEAVNRVSTVLRAAQTVAEMLPRLLDETLTVLNTDVGNVWLVDHPGQPNIARGWFTHISAPPLEPGQGIAGHVIATGEVYLVPDFAADPRMRESVRQQIPAGWGGACVPIRTTEGVVGVMSVAVPLPRRLTADEAHLLTTLTEIAGNAIHRSRLHEQTIRQVQRMAALHAIDTAISSSTDLRVTLNVLLRHVTAELRVDAAAVLLLNPHLNELEFAAGRGFRGNGVSHLRLQVGEDYAGQAALERRIVSVPNPKEARPFVKAHLAAGEDFSAYYGVPLIAKGQVKGVLEVMHRSPLAPDPDWLGFLETLAEQAAIAIDNAQLFDGLQRSNTELLLAYDITIEGWSRALDLRDRETEGHTQRVTDLTLQLAAAVGLSQAELVHVRRGALLHDIGKMAVPDSILLKPGPLTDEEWVTMRKHPQYAYDLLAPIAFLRPALDIPYCHHEKWDGTGYPRGLKGEAIPQAARIFAVVDVWDALCSDRPYRKAWSMEKAYEHLTASAGTHFDPKIVALFMQ